MAIEFARNGAKIILSARSETNLERVKGRCLDVGASLDSIAVFPFDVTNTAKHEAIFQKAIKLFGRLDILVNNAGRSQRAVWENIDFAVDKEIFKLNVFSVLSLSRLAVKYFENAGIFGHLVVTSSLAGVFGAPFSSSYNGSKHAIHGYFNTLRMEKGRDKLAVTLLCPGPVFSNFLSQCFTEKAGEVFGEEINKTDKRMETSRCAYLSAVAIVNRLDEVWMAVFPAIPLTYILVYYPNITKLITRFIGQRRIMKIRDSRQTVITENNPR
ncbi:dehydrogenase/reductase SDR family member 7-like isoform X2 [Rhodnius prolixus]